MTNTTKLIIAAAAIGAAVYVYKRGREQHAAVGQESDVGGTLRAGVKAVYSSVTASTPTTMKAPPVDAFAPSFAGSDPRQTQRVPTKSRTRLNQLLATSIPITQRELTSIGIGN